MLTAEQYRAKAAEYTELLKAASSPAETREFHELEQSFLMLAENEEWMAVNLDRTIRRRKKRDNHTALEEQQVLRCLGAAVIMRWNTIPTKLQRELFDCASTAYDSRQTLKGQIARFLHDHKDDEQHDYVSNHAGNFARGNGADIDQ